MDGQETSEPASLLPSIISVNPQTRGATIMESRIVTSVDIKAEPSSPTITLDPIMTSVDMKVEPSSPSPILPLIMTSVDIKVEPSSPPPILPPVTVDMQGKELSEPLALLPSTISLTTLTSSTETSGDATTIDSVPRISDGTSGTSARKPGRTVSRSVSKCDQSNEHGHCFSSEASAKDHLPKPSGKKPHACPICGRKFALRYQLKNHNRNIHTAEMRFACELCPSKFRRKISLDRHKKLHERGVDLCHCFECGKTFERMTALQQHLKWHKRDKPYPCHLCLARFTNKHNLEDHVRTHTGEKPHKCTMCEKRFAWRAGLKVHVRRIHGVVETAEATPESSAEVTLPNTSPSTARSPGPLNMDGKETCEPAAVLPRVISINPQAHSTESSGDVATLDSNSGIPGGTLGAPVKKPGSSVSKCYECTVCGRRFKWKHCLLNHRVLHTGEKPYACSICGRKFAQRTGFLNHKASHTNEMRFACELCPSKFRRKISLDRHKQLHERGVDLCHCPECGKTFQRMTALQWHLKWHERDKPYPCHLCPARFINKADRDNHVLVHTGEKPHKCPVCEKGFAWWSNLKMHIRSSHGSVRTARASVSSSVEMILPDSPPGHP
ncbi:uncharacterized protein LOC142560175 [Dermacentor variabilis]|uniref:uncharacterized protein LOC142560175 n=1 Tax=Dermacentor variabilis TaxID=34621 RepID=UPI003F5C427B